MTALILFSASLIFAPVRHLFFPSVIDSYPLICRAEATVDAPRRNLVVEFYIINRRKDAYTNETLTDFLQQNNSDTQSVISPNIELKMSREVGRIESASADTEFNRSKGELNVSHKERSATISIDKIEPRAILRVLVVVADLPELRASPQADQYVTRVDKNAVPLVFDQYLDACYTRP